MSTTLSSLRRVDNGLPHLTGFLTFSFPVRFKSVVNKTGGGGGGGFCCIELKKLFPGCKERL